MSLGALSGCGTAANLRGETVMYIGPAPFPCSTKPFGGVLQDVEISYSLPYGFLLLGDMPLSLAGDVVTLPWTTFVYVHDRLNPMNKIGRTPPPALDQFRDERSGAREPSP
jgi:hypothetical protein